MALSGMAVDAVMDSVSVKTTFKETLLEKVLLEAEMLDLKANPDRKATGSIIESSLDKGRGYVATMLAVSYTHLPKLVEEDITFAYDEIKYTKYIII